MPEAALAELYRAYIACLNRQDWPDLHRFVADDARHNGRPFGLAGYRAMLEQDFEAIPDLKFNIELMICEPPWVASRLQFDCRPKGIFLGLPVNGRRVVFAENVFYQFRGGRIAEVWSVIDKARSRRSFEGDVRDTCPRHRERTRSDPGAVGRSMSSGSPPSAFGLLAMTIPAGAHSWSHLRPNSRSMSASLSST